MRLGIALAWHTLCWEELLDATRRAEARGFEVVYHDGDVTMLGSDSQRDVLHGWTVSNALIARTRAGEELIAAAAEAGALTLEYDIPPDTMSLYQPHQVNKKYAAWARHQGLGDAGRIVPHTERLRIEELARDLPDATNEFQRGGTRERVEIGKATEPRPEAWKP